jgi:hypothetical protein
LRGVDINQAYVTGTVEQKTLYLIAVGCDGVYAVPISAKSTAAPKITESDLIVAKSTCPFPGSLNLLDTVTSGPHGEIAILAQDRTLAGFPMVIEVGTIADGSTEYPLSDSPTHGQADYEHLALDPVTGDVYVEGNIYGATTDIVVMWTYHADTQTVDGPTEVAEQTATPVFGMSIAAYDGRIAIATTAHYRGTVDARSAAGTWSGFQHLPGSNSPGSGPIVAFDPGSSRIVAIHATSAPKGRAELRANIFIPATGWSAPTVLTRPRKAAKAAFTKIPHIFLSIRPDGKVSYAYRVVQMYRH